MIDGFDGDGEIIVEGVLSVKTGGNPRVALTEQKFKRKLESFEIPRRKDGWGVILKVEYDSTTSSAWGSHLETAVTSLSGKLSDGREFYINYELQDNGLTLTCHNEIYAVYTHKKRRMEFVSRTPAQVKLNYLLYDQKKQCSDVDRVLKYAREAVGMIRSEIREHVPGLLEFLDTTEIKKQDLDDIL